MSRLAHLLRYALVRLRYRIKGIPYGRTALTDPTNAGGRILSDEEADQ